MTSELPKCPALCLQSIYSNGEKIGHKNRFQETLPKNTKLEVNCPPMLQFNHLSSIGTVYVYIDMFSCCKTLPKYSCIFVYDAKHVNKAFLKVHLYGDLFYSSALRQRPAFLQHTIKNPTKCDNMKYGEFHYENVSTVKMGTYNAFNSFTLTLTSVNKGRKHLFVPTDKQDHVIVLSPK